MKLKEFDEVALEDYIVNVNKNGKLVAILEDSEEKEKYQDATVLSIHVYDENTMVVNVERK